MIKKLCNEGTICRKEIFFRLVLNTVLVASNLLVVDVLGIMAESPPFVPVPIEIKLLSSVISQSRVPEAGFEISMYDLPAGLGVS